jgi:hypothetical protein
MIAIELLQRVVGVGSEDNPRNARCFNFLLRHFVSSPALASIPRVYAYGRSLSMADQRMVKRHCMSSVSIA